MESIPTPTALPNAGLYIEDEVGLFRIRVRVLRTAPTIELQTEELSEQTLQRLRAALASQRK